MVVLERPGDRDGGAIGGKEVADPRVGVDLVPERRESQGLSLSLSLLENVTIPRVRVHGSPGWLRSAWQRSEADWVIEELGVRPPAHAVTVGTLSGGNQQKVLLGKWLRGEPSLLVLHEPTRAVDVAARRDLLSVIFRAAAAGSGVLVAGMDANELQSMCDRVLIMYAGRIVETCRAGELKQARHPYTRGLLEALPRVDEDRPQLPTLRRDPAWLEGPPA